MTIIPKQKSLYITVDYKDFIWHYQRSFNHSKANSFVCENNCALEESIVLLLEAMDSFFNAINNLFVSRQYEKNITLYTLLKLLEKDDRPEAPLEWKLDVYRNYLEANDLSFKDHLIEAFLSHLNKIHKRKPKYKKNYRLFYFITCEIKSFLFKIIRKIIYKSKRDFFTNSSYFCKTVKYFDIHIDSGYLFKIEKEKPLVFFLYMKYTESCDDKGFDLFLKKFSNKSLKNKEDICQLIKDLLYSS